MDDLISRQAAIDAVYKCPDIFAGDMPVMVVKADAYEALAQLPSAEPDRKKGKWIKKDSYYDGIIMRVYKCSLCDGNAFLDEDELWYKTDFCPHCGADMRGGEYEQENDIS